jgi:hypothetical protein
MHKILRMHRLLMAGAMLVLLTALATFPSAARTDIRTIQAGDMLFIYEENIDITALRTGANPVTALRKYQNDRPTDALLREITVTDDTGFTLIPEAFGDQLGIYWAWNPTDGAMRSVYIQVPSITIDAVLASPNHSDSIRGLTIPEGTAIAFKTTSVDVGSTYHAGALYPATVDLVLTTPGGAQLTTIQGKDFSGMNVSSLVFYTDDPGRPGAITLEGLGTGTFGVQAKWSNPPSFDAQAADSNLLTFVIGGTTVSQSTPTPVVTAITTAATPRATVTTPVPVSTAATTTPPPAPTTAAQTPPATTPVRTEPPQPSPTSMPAGLCPALLAPALALLPLLKGRQGR